MREVGDGTDRVTSPCGLTKVSAASALPGTPASEESNRSLKQLALRSFAIAEAPT